MSKGLFGLHRNLDDRRRGTEQWAYDAEGIVQQPDIDETCGDTPGPFSGLLHSDLPSIEQQIFANISPAPETEYPE